MTTLTHLSLQRAPRLHKQMPNAYTNAERYRDFRMAMALIGTRIGNEFRFPFHGSQSGANPGPTNPAGCQLSQAQRYAMEQSPPDPITNYADRRGV